MNSSATSAAARRPPANCKSPENLSFPGGFSSCPGRPPIKLTASDDSSSWRDAAARHRPALTNRYLPRDGRLGPSAERACLEAIAQLRFKHPIIAVLRLTDAQRS